MPSEIAMPFRLDSSNKVAVEGSPDAQVRQHVLSLMNTNTGERAVLGGYGLPLEDLLFDTDPDNVAHEAVSDIEHAMALYEPGVQLLSVRGSGNEDGEVDVAVNYQRADGPATGPIGSNANVAVITSSGKVSEVIRG